MRFPIIAVLLLACACTPPPANSPNTDAAGNRMEALTENAGRWCSGDGVWCMAPGQGAVAITRGDAQLANLAAADPEVWPYVIRLGRDDESAIVGLVSTETQMYSGGGGSAKRVTLFEVAPGREAQQLTGFPLSGNLMIRVCFSEEDVQARRGACHDEYDFVGTLGLDPSVTEGEPRLVLTTEASTFPGRATRNDDSTARAPLQETDLVRWRVDACSFRRVAPKVGDVYVWDEAFPACSDYLEP